MYEDTDNATTDDLSVDSLSNPGSCKLVLDINLRKTPKSIVDSQLARLATLKKKTHALKLENESLRTENSAMKKNIERYYELVLKARENKKPKGNSSVSSLTLCVGIILACTVHLNIDNESISVGERRLMSIVKQEWSVLLSYILALALVVTIESVRKWRLDQKVLIC